MEMFRSWLEVWFYGSFPYVPLNLALAVFSAVMVAIQCRTEMQESKWCSLVVGLGFIFGGALWPVVIVLALIDLTRRVGRW